MYRCVRIEKRYLYIHEDIWYIGYVYVLMDKICSLLESDWGGPFKSCGHGSDECYKWNLMVLVRTPVHSAN